MIEKEKLNAMRLDKWLWCARFYKTRALAAAAIKGNKVKVNDDNIKVARNVRIGDQLEIHKTPFKYTLKILDLNPYRLSATGARQLYSEDPASIEERELLNKQLKAEAAAFPRTRGRPTKRNRREIIRFTRRPTGERGEE